MGITCFNDKGNPINLTDIIKSGGEGTIYKIQGQTDTCAKIYHSKKIISELHDKILTMVNNPPEDPTWSSEQKHRSIAWPEELIYHDSKKTKFAGFLMPFIDTNYFKESHKYYAPADRLKECDGNFTWQHLFTSAFNLTSSIAAIHEKGHCIGDLRETNILVGKNALITLIDCDSFQIKDKKTNKTFYTLVGTGEYLPPELMNVNFKNYDRYYSDLFALGVLIFKFLMNGVHPYSAIGKGVENSPSIEDKIKKGYFPYTGQYKDVKPPLFALSYNNIIPSSIQQLLYMCFVEGHKNPEKRPEAEKWYNVLSSERKKLEECGKNKNHWFSSSINTCPWCKIAKTDKDWFPPKSPQIGEQIALNPSFIHPKLKVSKKNFKFLKTPTNLSFARSFTISNIGGETLTGTIITKTKWLTVKTININIDNKNKKKQQIKFFINPQNLPFGFEDTGIIEINTNGGNEKIKIKLFIEMGPPQLEVNKKNFEFLELKKGELVLDDFTISNMGGDILNGTIISNKKWLTIKKTNISPDKIQNVPFVINTFDLPFEFEDTGIIEINSNGGNETVSVGINIPLFFDIPKTNFKFSIKKGETASGVFTIINSSDDILTGTITSNKAWLNVFPTIIASKKIQIIKFNIDTSDLPFEFEDTGIIEINSNGGTGKVFISLSLEN